MGYDNDGDVGVVVNQTRNYFDYFAEVLFHPVAKVYKNSTHCWALLNANEPCIISSFFSLSLPPPQLLLIALTRWFLTFFVLCEPLSGVRTTVNPWLKSKKLNTDDTEIVLFFFLGNWPKPFTDPWTLPPPPIPHPPIFPWIPWDLNPQVKNHCCNLSKVLGKEIKQ